MICYHRKWNLTRWKRRSEVKRPDKPKNKEPPETKMCKVCGEYPIANGNKIMCNQCFREASNYDLETTEINFHRLGGQKYDK